MSDQHPAVKALGEILTGVRGTYAPHVFFKRITTASEQPDWSAALILAEICHWYAPKPNGEKRFGSDLLQLSRCHFAERFGISHRAVRDALVRLEKKGVIRRVYRTVRTDSGRELHNTLFIEIVPEKIREYIEADCNRVLKQASRGYGSELQQDVEADFNTPIEAGFKTLHKHPYKKTTDTHTHSAPDGASCVSECVSPNGDKGAAAPSNPHSDASSPEATRDGALDDLPSQRPKAVTGLHKESSSQGPQANTREQKKSSGEKPTEPQAQEMTPSRMLEMFAATFKSVRNLEYVTTNADRVELQDKLPDMLKVCRNNYKMLIRIWVRVLTVADYHDDDAKKDNRKFYCDKILDAGKGVKWFCCQFANIYSNYRNLRVDWERSECQEIIRQFGCEKTEPSPATPERKAPTPKVSPTPKPTPLPLPITHGEPRKGGSLKAKIVNSEERAMSAANAEALAAMNP